MNDMSEKVSEILSDPASMEKIMAIAQNLSAGKTEQASLPSEDGAAAKPALPEMAKRLMPVLETYTKSANDPKVQLLIPLKPMVSEKKQKNIDDAISVMRLAGVATKLFEKGDE